MLINLIAEMIELTAKFNNTYTNIEDTAFFSKLPLTNLDIRLNCARIIDWIYYDGNDPSHPFWIEESGHLEKSFLQFMSLSPIKEFFAIKEGNFAFVDTVTENDAKAAVQYVKINYKPQIFIHRNNIS